MARRLHDDEELERGTNRIMLGGTVLLFAMVLVFPLYRWYEPGTRTDAREQQEASLARSGEALWSVNCASCHGLVGEGTTAPALDSQQFLQSATDEQMALLISVGVPGTQMNPYAQDFGGAFTSEQIKAVVTYIRLWEEDAPDRPDWRDPQPDSAAGAESESEADADGESDPESDTESDSESDSDTESES